MNGEIRWKYASNNVQHNSWPTKKISINSTKKPIVNYVDTISICRCWPNRYLMAWNILMCSDRVRNFRFTRGKSKALTQSDDLKILNILFWAIWRENVLQFQVRRSYIDAYPQDSRHPVKRYELRTNNWTRGVCPNSCSAICTPHGRWWFQCISLHWVSVFLIFIPFADPSSTHQSSKKKNNCGNEFNLCFCVAVLSIVVIAMMNWVTNIISWFICIFVTVAAVAITIILWLTYYDVSHQQETTIKFSQFEEFIRNENALYAMAIIASIVLVSALKSV